ncbi:MAG: sigma-54-dependent Fis family transcriptional regulator [Planctomycetota bacterium]|nr:sigma-54-dependent Fis family transcriptional regulator [Planctomycetota bacterium]
MPRVLAVDDEQVMRSLLEKALPRWGYDVTLVGDAEEAVERFAPRRFDVVLTDLRLPGRSGLELLDQLKQLDPATPVVVMTAFGSIATAVDAVRRGAADFVTKPLELSYLELALRRTLDQKRATEELERLRPHADEREGLGGLVGRSLPMKQVYSLIDKVGPTQLTVLVLGESGTGKELCARAIHAASPRAGERFQAVNCAAFSETLLESELFGHERGAFTGADKRKQGHFEVAQGGTLFLDEIAESPPSVQAKLLRARLSGARRARRRHRRDQGGRASSPRPTATRGRGQGRALPAGLYSAFVVPDPSRACRASGRTTSRSSSSTSCGAMGLTAAPCPWRPWLP